MCSLIEKYCGHLEYVWNPGERRDFIRRLHDLGFVDTYSGTKHQFMVIGQHRLTIPSKLLYHIHQRHSFQHKLGDLLFSRSFKLFIRDTECLH